MELQNINELWCRTITAELIRHGVKHAVLCPGGRSAMLSLVLASTPQLSTLVQTDERSGAFLALGIAKVTDTPVAMCTTSGTAVANLLPAAVEAEACGLPLVMLTCDRPRWQRDNGAPQYTNQPELCRSVVRGQLDLEDPCDDLTSLQKLSQQVAVLLQCSCDPANPGPVHINIPLSGRLISTEPDPGWQPSPEVLAFMQQQGNRLSTAAVPQAQPSPSELGKLASELGLRPGLKGVIVAGPDCPLSAYQVRQMAITTGYPVLADAPSGLRRPAVTPNLVCEADILVLSQAIATQSADLIVRLGSAPISHTLHGWLGKQRCPVLRIDARKIQRDFLHQRFHLLCHPDNNTLQSLFQLGRAGDTDWLMLWTQMSQQARRRRADLVECLPWGDCQAAAIACNARGFELLHLGNSMSIRHGNLHCSPTDWPQEILANRGVNGIDGTISTFLGELVGSGLRGLLLLGDQAMLHDLPALETAYSDNLRGTICILNNGGGGIFDLLRCSHLPHYQEVVKHPLKVEFGAIAQGFDLPYWRCHTAAELTEALAESALGNRVGIVEAIVPPNSLARDLSSLYRRIISKDGI